MNPEDYKYMCINTPCSARYLTPQDYCRVCHSDVELMEDEEQEEKDGEE